MGKSHLFEKKSVLLKPIEVLLLFIRVRSQGARVESVPLKRLIEFSNCSFRQWNVEKVGNGYWLILEAV